MATFVKLSDAGSGQEVWINPDMVILARPADTGTWLRFSRGGAGRYDGITVSESITVVVTALAR